MEMIGLTDIIKPVMVSLRAATAGALRIAYMARSWPPASLPGARSSACSAALRTPPTGHGTDKAWSPACWLRTRRSAHPQLVRTRPRGGARLQFTPARTATTTHPNTIDIVTDTAGRRAHGGARRERGQAARPSPQDRRRTSTSPARTTPSYSSSDLPGCSHIATSLRRINIATARL